MVKLVFILSLFLVLTGCNNAEIEIVDKTVVNYCETNDNCIYFNGHCGWCGCDDMIAINKKYENSYCNDYKGKHCDEICQDKEVKCVDNKCIINN